MLLASVHPARAAQIAVTLLALVGAAVARGFAAESEGRFAPVVTRPSESDSITVSKKEFDAAKSSRDPALQQKGDVPRLSAPDLSTGISDFGGLPATKPDSTEKDKKSANWLVDAMEKKPSSSVDRSKRSSRGGFAEGESERDRDPFREVLARSSSDPRKDSASPNRDSDSPDAKQNGEKTTSVVNPLDRYLAGWMSPGDYALLKPGLTESASGGRAGNSGSSSSLPQLPGVAGLALPGTSSIAGMLPGTTAPLVAPPPPHANPYLEILNGPGPAALPSPAVTYVPPPVVTPAPKVPIFAPPPAPIEPSRSKVPDFVKPADDEKYYKQLKRF